MTMMMKMMQRIWTVACLNRERNDKRRSLQKTLLSRSTLRICRMQSCLVASWKMVNNGSLLNVIHFQQTTRVPPIRPTGIRPNSGFTRSIHNGNTNMCLETISRKSAPAFVAAKKGLSRVMDWHGACFIGSIWKCCACIRG